MFSYAIRHLSDTAPGALPYDAEVEYLESSTTGQYIDTGITFDRLYDFEVEVNCCPVVVTRSVICGTYSNNGTSFNLEFGGSDNGIERQPRGYVEIGGGALDKRASAVSLNVLAPISLSYRASDRLMTLKSGNETVTGTVASGSGTSSNTLWLFNDHRSGGMNRQVRISSIKVKKDGEIVRDMISVKVGGEYCLYDKANPTGGTNGDGLYHNAGTGVFSGGSDKALAKLPYDAEVEYIESTGTQYIDTCIVPQAATFGFDADISVVAIPSETSSLFGSRNATASSGSHSYNAFLNSSGWIRADMLGSATNFVKINAGNHISISYTPTTTTVDGTSQANGTKTNCSYSFYIFTHNNAGSAFERNVKQRVYSFKLYENNVIVCDLIPVRVGTEYCLYDKANPTGGDNGDGLYHNKGTGAFLGGVDRPSAGTKFLVSRVMGSTKPYDAEVEYVESNGTQYVDTGVNADSSLGFKIKGTIGTEWGHFIGAMRDSTYLMAFRQGGHAKVQRGSLSSVSGPSSNATTPNVYFVDTITNSCGVDSVSTTRNTGAFDIKANFYLFAGNRVLSSQTDIVKISGRLWYAQLWVSGTLVRDFQPVRIGQVGYLYDKVSGELFGSATATPLIAGPDRCKIKPVLKHYDIAVKYRIDECNGNLQTAESANFPSGKYTALDYTPTYEHHRFVGWQNSSQDGEAEFLDSLPTGLFTSTGGNVMLTGVIPGPNTSFEIKAAALNQTTTNVYGISNALAANSECRWGCDETIDGVRTMYRINTNMGGWSYAYAFYKVGNDNGNYAQFKYKSADIGIFGYDASSKTVYTKTDASVVVDSKVLPDETTIKQFTSEFKFFGCPATSTAPAVTATSELYCRPARLYYAKFWESGVLIRDYVPYVKDGVACLLDKVSGTFLYNYGTGIMMSGPLKATPVEYIAPSDNIIYDAKLISAVWQSPTTVTFDATTNGGQMPSDWIAPDYYEGQPYGTLPIPTKSGEVFLGWFTSGGTHVTESSTVTTGTLTARYAAVTWGTTYSCTTTSSYKNTGIYSANRYSSSDPIVVDWGDGTIDVVYGNISQLAHTYSSVGTFTVKISDNISTFCPSYNNDTWYNTTSQNRYTLKQVLTLSSRVSQLSAYAFYYCSTMTDAIIPSGVTSIPDYCFYYCSSLKSSSVQLPSTVTVVGRYAFAYCQSSNFNSITIPASCTSIYYGAFNCCYYLHPVFEAGSSTLSLGGYAFSSCGRNGSAFSIDLSTRSITAIPTYCFYNCGYLKGITWPQGLTSIGGSAFRNCFSYAASTGTVEIPEGVTSISGTYAFGNCLYLTAVTLPSTLTNLNNYTFYGCTRLATITSNRSTAPTVSSATFGNNTTYYTGRASYSAGTNKLYVPAGSTGYNASYWSSVLLDSTKCGFTLEYAPYVPTSFPVGVKITRLSDNTVVYEGTLTDTSTCNTITGTAPVYVGPDSSGYVLGWGPPLDSANGGVSTFYYNATTFEILEISTSGVDVSGQYKAEWVEVTS